jgi:DNA invertase Pin-like site-specific DNA recombinase
MPVDTLERPALQQLLRDIEAGHVDCIVCYKIDRLSRSLLDFAQLVEQFDRHGVTFMAVTQSFNRASVRVAYVRGAANAA